jgi:hypothetical protein
MRLSIEANTLTVERWFPIFDLLLLHLEDRRHAFATDDIDQLLGSAWLQRKGRADRELITHLATARSHDRLADKNVVRIDLSAPAGGRIDDNFTTSLHPRDCLTFLAQPFSVIVENEWFDGAFLLWIARALKRDNLIDAYRANRFVFRHAGGKGSLERSASVLSRGVWPAPNGRHSRAMRLWACAVLDNDSKYPGHVPNDVLIAGLTPWVAFVHELARRSIESYLPHTALTRYDRSNLFKDRVDALFRLSADQRRHYHMKNGLRLKDDANPTKAAYMAAPEIAAQEKALFGPILAADWPKLASGFGKKLSAIYTDDAHRPVAADLSAIEDADKVEFGRLLDAIYERI